MRVVAFIGDHARHRYFLQLLRQHMPVRHAFVQTGEPELPSFTDHPSMEVRRIAGHHFRTRKKVEAEWFGGVDPAQSHEFDTTLFQDFDTAQGQAVMAKVARLRADLLISFGIGILPSEILEHVGAAWNMHGGLSPWFRGTATMFWPSYLLQPQFTGVTLHEISSQVDAGAVIHQSGPVLVRGDGLHQLSARTLSKGMNDCVQIIKRAIDSNSLPESVPQTVNGRVFTSRDWKPEMCRVIYDTFGDAIVDMFLDGELPGPMPRLVSSPWVE